MQVTIDTQINATAFLPLSLTVFLQCHLTINQDNTKHLEELEVKLAMINQRTSPSTASSSGSDFLPFSDLSSPAELVTQYHWLCQLIVFPMTELVVLSTYQLLVLQNTTKM
eukprot:scaffold167874_cov68-Attheya_sp.AAC.3